ncbi:MAG: hypothetical protein AAB579_02090, partial [Patescibacteria group bacterium]
MTIPRRKTLILFALCLALVAGAVFWAGAEMSWAQRAGPGVRAPTPAAPAPAGSGAGTAVSTTLSGLASLAGTGIANAVTGISLVWGVLLVLYAILYWALGEIGGLLNYIYYLNMVIVPSQIAVVQAGWIALRDIANGLFILIILWIAVTIIFNLDNLGGKKLLVRVIVVALLINFSLLMVTTVFAFANQLALPFAKALKLDPFDPTTKTGIADIIVSNSRIHTTAQLISDNGVTQQLKREVEALRPPPPTGAAETETKQLNPSRIPLRYWFAGIWQSIGGAPAIQTAQALTPGQVTLGACLGAGIGVLSSATGILAAVGGPLAYGAGSVCITMLSGLLVTNAVVAELSDGSGGPIGGVFKQLLNLAVADLFLLLTALSILAALVILMVRIVAMIFIGVFAPIAFMGLVVPRYGERIWNMWLDNLFRWAFVAPIFYFLLYLSLLMLTTAAEAQNALPTQKLVPFQASGASILALSMFLVFLWASIFLTRKAAGMGAEAALTFGKKLAGVGLGL